uniref:Beta-microseminoprotein n=1 Tax=Catharus ustulatus TaxID=91951 RepID=A0A8C3UE13_CATUS
MSCFCIPKQILKSRMAAFLESGSVHEFDSRWRTEDCNDCSCSKTGIGCCDSYMTPGDYDEEKCESIFNKETCSYKVVEKDDHSKECPVHSWVG